eukprot:c5269_g1_i1.p1 GENE.c5269_g1_i1~~c5269_g1_i1.p1  ORF type:complete len:131 (+),score=31.39 c5269_g1_i1:25-417(+)
MQVTVGPAPQQVVYAPQPVYAQQQVYGQPQPQTIIGYEMTTEGWIWVIVLLFLCWPLAWIPCVCDSCKRPIYAGPPPQMMIVQQQPVGVVAPAYAVQPQPYVQQQQQQPPVAVATANPHYGGGDYSKGNY